MNRRDLNRLQDRARPKDPLDLGEFEPGEIELLVDTLITATRMHGRHPRAAAMFQLTRKIVDRVNAQVVVDAELPDQAAS